MNQQESFTVQDSGVKFICQITTRTFEVFFPFFQAIWGCDYLFATLWNTQLGCGLPHKSYLLVLLSYVFLRSLLYFRC